MSNQKQNPTEAAATFVRRMGIRPNLIGCRYLITAIEMTLRCPALSNSMMHGLYPAVASCYGVKPHAVERNIRKAIESAYDNDRERVCGMFYYRVGKPAISEVIALALETIRPQAYLFPERDFSADIITETTFTSGGYRSSGGTLHALA